MNADTLQQHEDHGRRWATALLAIGESLATVKVDALKSRGWAATGKQILATSAFWRYSALIEDSLAGDCAFVAGEFDACEEATR